MSERQWNTDTIVFGAGELDLRHAVDQIPPTRVARMKNVMRTLEGAVTPRPGQTRVVSTTEGSIVHSISRLEDPQNNTYTRLYGVDSGLYFGTSVMQQADIGYSGHPLSFVHYRPPLSGEAWVYIGDSSRMRKIRRDGLDLPIGLPAPTVKPSVALETEKTTAIETFNTHTDFAEHSFGSAVAARSSVTGKVGNATAFAVTTAEGYGTFDKAVTLNLASVGGVVSGDADLIHLYTLLSNPQNIDEFRIYFVCSTFTPGVVPGASATQNTDAYMKAFKPSELTAAIIPTSPTVSTSLTEAANARLRQKLRLEEIQRLEAEGVDLTGQSAVDAGYTMGSWYEYGIAGTPLRKSDFERIGTDSAKSWATITGIVVYVSVLNSTGGTVTLDDCYLTGGYGLDSSEAASIQYEYVYTNYDPRTGAESNQSPASTALDSLRRAISVDPTAYGDSNIRQRFYRKGGTLTDDYYFIGANDSDGAAVIDIYSDLEITLSGTVATDHDQPITTTNSAGSAVRNVPLRSIAGPLGGIYVFGCGDPYRKGHLYWCRPSEPDHWPVGNNLEVCSPSEELMASLMYNGQGYLFSRERLFQVVLNSTATGTTMTAVPTPSGHGLAAKYAFCVGPEIYFLSRDGIYAISGTIERNITEELLAPIFHREWTARDADAAAATGGFGGGGYGEGGFGSADTSLVVPGPIDWTKEDSMRMEIHENDLRFLYQDIYGKSQEIVYNLLTGEWRWNVYAKPPKCLYSEKYGQDSVLLFGGADGVVYEHSGTSDSGTSIDCMIRTGARNQGVVRAPKLYGDLTLDCDPDDASLSVRTYLDPDEDFNSSSTLTGEARDLFRADHFIGGVLGRTCSVEVLWSSATQRPLLYNASLAFTVEPELTGARVTDWDDCSTQGYKLVKGCIIECNTFNATKAINIEGDGVVQATVEVLAPGRRQVEIAFPAFQARLVRLVPLSSTDMMLYNVTWVADPLPLSLTRWETRPLDHGLFGYHVHFDAYITLNSSSDVVFEVLFDGTTLHSYTIPSTQGATKKMYIEFAPNKSLLAQYTLSSSLPFMIFRDETYVRLFPWDRGESVNFKPFGGANQDPSPRTP